jgi:hypothetical protein
LFCFVTFVYSREKRYKALRSGNFRKAKSLWLVLEFERAHTGQNSGLPAAEGEPLWEGGTTCLAVESSRNARKCDYQNKMQ